MRNRREFKVEELFDFTDERCLGPYCVDTYYMKWQQHMNELCRFPELLELFKLGFVLEVAAGWTFMRVKIPHNQSGLSLEDKRIPQILFEAFESCPNIAVYFEYGTWQITSSPKYIFEDFKHFRNRTLFDLRDHLGLDHKGRGVDSIRLPKCVR